jgi:hypothetical protein
LAEDGGDEDTVLFGDDFFRDTTFFFDKEGCIAV